MNLGVEVIECGKEGKLWETGTVEAIAERGNRLNVGRIR
jgi:hypothetical protein